MKPQAGLTLIELMVSVAIVAILTTIAVPAYNQFTTVARRDDAKQALLNLANAQEQFYFTNNTYTAVFANLGEVAISPQGQYTLAIPVANAIAFTLTAAPVGLQVGDGNFQLDSVGNKTWQGLVDAAYSCLWPDSKTANPGC